MFKRATLIAGWFLVWVAMLPLAACATEPSNCPSAKQVQNLVFNGGSFTGATCNGIPHGVGAFTDHQGSIYKGNFVEGYLEGEGTKRTPAGSVYSGIFKKGRMHGKYLSTIDGKPSAFTYWHTDRRVSLSYIWHPSQYQGEFNDIGQRHGQGTFRYDDGGVYTGQWVNDEPHGEGSYKWVTGGSYTGRFWKGFRDGFGVVEFPDGYRYEGEYVESLKHGQGKERLTNGDIYIGRFWKDARHGEGQCINSNGASETCRYDQGHLLPDGVPITPLSDDAGVASYTSKSKTSPDGVLPEGVGELLEFELTDECWVRVSDANGEVLVVGVKKRGHRIRIHGLAPLTIVLGNPSGVNLQRNGHPVDLSAYLTGRLATITIEKKTGSSPN